MNEIGDLLDAVDLEWLLEREGISYKESYGRSGRQLNARTCPFCHVSQYKVYINAETGVGNCFSGSCPQGTFSKWSLIGGIFEAKGKALVDILKSLAKEQGWRPKELKSALTFQDLNTLDIPEGAMPVSDQAEMPEYLARRGIEKELAKYFSLHYGDTATWKYLNPDGREGKQDYSKRIILPIFDMDGAMVSFQGRDTTGEAEQRYLFPPGFASAGAYLYNGCNVVDGTETVVLCEGVFDVIQTKRALDSDETTKDIVPIGSFGMHLSSGNPSGDDQLGRLRQLKQKGLKNVIFLWDGERKAFEGAIAAALRCKEVGLVPSIAFLEDGKDPGNSYPSKIIEAVKTAAPCGSKLEALRVMQRAKTYRTA